jgi:predicted  nucleic acid-binding Zn-ribbon protein
MVDVSHSSIDRVKVLTEHDLLKFLGTMTTAVLIPLVLWMFISTHNQLEKLTESYYTLHEQVAVLEDKLKKHHEYTATKFTEAKDQLTATSTAVQGLREDAVAVIKVMNTKTAKVKDHGRR